MSDVVRMAVIFVGAVVVSFLVSFTATGGWQRGAALRRKAKGAYARGQAMIAETDATLKWREEHPDFYLSAEGRDHRESG